MRKVLAFTTLVLCANSHAVEFDNALGFGLQYGGSPLGWQGSISGEHLHGRVGVGLIGWYEDFGIVNYKSLSLGGDISINKFLSLGATATTVDNHKFETVNLNYNFRGVYTEGWRVGLDVGYEINNADSYEYIYRDEPKSKMIFFSFGYSFK